MAPERMAARRRDGDDPGGSEFERAMEGVRPLEGRDKQRPPPEPKKPRGRTRRTKRTLRFEIEEHGEHVTGLADDVDPKHLARLRRADAEVDRRVDLHGLDTTRARLRLRGALEAAYTKGDQCVLVVHGRGLRSAEGPVLKRAVPEWIAEPPLSGIVMAFASAPAREGGPGATRVLLRRKRR